MNYEQVRQRKDGRFDWTNMNDGVIYPIGYCRPFSSFRNDPLFGHYPEEFHLEHEKFKDNYHNDGHETADEAAACYKKYLLDRRAQYMQEHLGAQYQCKICNAWTGLYASIDGWPVANLCLEHNNREALEQLYVLTGDSSSIHS